MEAKKKLLILFLLALGTHVLAQEQTAQPRAEADPLTVVKNFLTAYMQRDHAAFSSYLHPDIVWLQPGDNRISGIKKSKAELLQMGVKMAELSAGTIQVVDVKHYAVNGSTVACVLHWTGAQPPGGTLDVTNIDIYTVENGKIIMARIFSDDIEQENRFWGK